MSTPRSGSRLTPCATVAAGTNAADRTSAASMSRADSRRRSGSQLSLGITLWSVVDPPDARPYVVECPSRGNNRRAGVDGYAASGNGQRTW